MKVLHVNDTDLRGARFNGFDLLDDLGERGIEAAMAVLRKRSDDPRVTALLRGAADEAIDDALWRMEYGRSLNGILAPWARALVETPAFRDADVVHYHLVHNGVVSLLDLPWLTALRPSVWTFHDLWPLTGHCVQPLECDGWRAGCQPCPHPDRWFAIERDCAGVLWELKRGVYAESTLDVVAASEFTAHAIADSPLAASLPYVHTVPFGVRSERFLPDEERAASRAGFGIGEDEFVIALRAADGPLKGTPLVVEALGTEPPKRPTTVLAFDGVGLLGPLKRHYRVIELGWVGDDEAYARALSACDVFVMPSLAESFGLMAVEAIGAGRPVVCLEGTAVESVTHAPSCGVAVPPHDAGALRRALDALAGDPAERRERGERGRRIARDVYGYERYLSGLERVYRTAVARSGPQGGPEAL